MSKSYPTDGIGNELKKGQLVMVKLTDDRVIFRVTELEPASDISVIPVGPKTQPIALRGTITLQATISLQFPQDAAFGHILVLQEPEDAPMSLKASGATQ